MQRLLLNTVATFLVFSVTACGRSGTGIQLSMDTLHSHMVTVSVEKLQLESKNPAVNFTSVNPKMIIEAISDEEVKKYGDNVLGVAFMGSNPCKIQIAERTFQYSQDLLDTVVWHEIGHCFEMEHEDNYFDIMYKSAKPFSWYSKEMIATFIGRLYEKTR